MELNTTRIGKRGVVVIPAGLRRKYRLEEGSLMVAEERAEGILLRPVATVPIEIYSLKRQAEFLLNNAVDLADYAWAVKQVQKMGLDPDKIPHKKPTT
ncbi:MAG: AbrB/MazE/SpoVT family DNA-binding domain-containing protein [Deltaproteobacteria bacterium]|nr:AbrB/MazE/SpoVT family DNA-binding domain-containing protein [Deltaproteobacteria bacterium]